MTERSATTALPDDWLRARVHAAAPEDHAFTEGVLAAVAHATPQARRGALPDADMGLDLWAATAWSASAGVMAWLAFEALDLASSGAQPAAWLAAPILLAMGVGYGWAAARP